MNHKKTSYRYLLLAFIFGVFCCTSCSQALEDEPLNELTERYAWDPEDSLGIYPRNFLHNIYTYLPNGYNRIGDNILCAASDDAVPTAPGSSIANMTNGGYGPWSNPDDAWQKNYYGIRRVNMFLKNFPIVPMKDLTTKKYWTAEARFLRAMFYFELVKRYGGIPLVGDNVYTLEDDLELPRNTFDECVQYIVSECDAIKNDLRTDPVDDSNWGRASRGAAMTLKSKILLLAASPLNNPGNEAERWKLAADAAMDVRNLKSFTLVSSFSSLFTTRKNTEVIMAFQRANTTDVETDNAPVGYQNGQTYSRGSTSPTQELVDAFPMANGLPITDPLSGYNPQDPYKSRDPRFYASVFHNGMKWLGRPVETFEGGLDNPNGPLPDTRTGYYMRKFMANFENSTAYSNQSHNFIIFRFAEVLLNSAEAQNEYLAQPNADIYTILKDIRKRGGIAAGSNGMYGLKANMTKEEMRQAIRNERRIEMAFEEQRFWDLRRWMIAEDVYNKPLHGMRITKDPVQGTLTYDVFALKTPFIFVAPKMYRYPIPFSEIVKNKNLVQNTGW